MVRVTCVRQRAGVVAACLSAFATPGCTPVPEAGQRDAAEPHGQVIDASPAGAATARIAPVPSRFRGEWNRVPADCGTGRNDSRLVLSIDRAAFHESGGRIVSVTRHASDGIGIAVEMSGEGERWIARYRFRLSEDGRRLTDVGDSAGLTRYRCG